MICQEYRFSGTAMTADNVTVDMVRVNERNDSLEKRSMLPALSLLYVLNGNHDPRKVQRLSIVLSILFLAGGLFFRWDLLTAGFLFAGAAVVNGVTFWYIQNFSDDSVLPVQGDILSHIELWTGRPVRNQHRPPG